MPMNVNAAAITSVITIAVCTARLTSSDDHARTGGKTHERADQHIDDRADRAHGGKRLVAHKIAHNPRIDGVVELLKQIAEHQREGKGYDVAHDAALRHIHVAPFPAGFQMILCHNQTFFDA